MSSVSKRPDGRYRDPGGVEHAKYFARKVDAQHWLDSITASQVRDDYVDPRSGKVCSLASIRPADVRHLVATMSERLAPATVRTNYGVLRAVLNTPLSIDP